MTARKDAPFKTFHSTPLGQIVLGDSLDVLSTYDDGSVNLIMTSPPFGLVRKKDYGNVEANEYVDWFKPFGAEFHRVLADNGSLVIDIGGAWNKGYPTRNLYHFKLLIMLCEEIGFHLAQDIYWWNPSKLPTPAEWVTVRRLRVKDAINTVWWLSKTPWPKASNRRVLQPYSASMEELLEKGYKAKKRPSGHDRRSWPHRKLHEEGSVRSSALTMVRQSLNGGPWLRSSAPAPPFHAGSGRTSLRSPTLRAIASTSATVKNRGLSRILPDSRRNFPNTSSGC